MSRAPARRCLCDFCGADLRDVELMLRSKIGGMPPQICSCCVDQIGAALAEARGLAAAAAPLRMVGGERVAP